MKCQQCAKVATLQITEVLSEGNFEELHLCDECAQKYLLESVPKKKKLDGRDSSGSPDKQCEHCGTRFVDFRNSGRLGCPHDYQAFQAELLPLLESIHSSTRHTGKTPRRPSHRVRSQELTRLRKDLQRAITSEAYEDAAAIRDRIRRLEEG
ncbi:MAG TPA: UvrB/UvrC motif-containing protein [Gemmataceae bacterium]|jgi:protein arginine kinase activator|nr:UvrB/UvrC motif-containing protein [Gemmataceae bacterium]